MPNLPVSQGSTRIIILIRCGCWVALSIIGAMVVAAYFLLQAARDWLAAHGRRKPQLTLVEGLRA